MESVSDEQQAEIDRLEEERVQKQNEDDLRFIVNQPQGIRYFSRMLEMANTQSSIMTGNSYTYYHLGKKEFAEHLISEIKALDKDKFIKIISGVS
ncbi:MAG: hypothetical protein ACO2ZP_00585 [Bacteriovoracaceae bacterium]